MTDVYPIVTVDLESPSIGAKLEAAFEETGFVQLVGHGLDASTRSAFRKASDVFFALDLDAKLHYVVSDAAANRGYRAKGSEALSYSLGEASPPDLFESFNSAPDPVVAHQLCQPTPWPDADAAGFSTAAMASFSAMRTLAWELDELIGAELGIERLRSHSTTGPDMLASINYRPGPDGSESRVDGQQRMGAHSDYTTFTILDADPVRGLQIVSPDGTWVDVVPEPHAMLVNVGDLLAMWTNDRWPSTLHRVVPMAGGGAPVRRSVAYFHYPDLDVVVAPLPDEVHRAGGSPHYEPVTVESHLLSKLTAPKVHEPSTGTSTVAGRIETRVHDSREGATRE